MLRYLTVSWIILVSIFVLGTYYVNNTAKVAKAGLQDNLVGLAKSFAVALKEAEHEKVTLDTPDDDLLYLKILGMMSTWQGQIPTAASIYTCRKNTEGEIVFICCPPADLNRDGKFEGEREELVPKGTIYDEDEEDILEIFDAFDGNSGFNNVPTEDEWGLWVTATEPIFDGEGNIDAVLGVDFWGEEWNSHIWHAMLGPRLFLLSFVVLFFVVQVFVIRRQFVEDRLTEYAIELEKAMDDLVTAKEAADVAAQAKSLFLANISHEIRTPLNALLGCADIIIGDRADGAMQPSREQIIDIMRKSSQNLTVIIDDVLTFSSIDANRMVLESIPVDLRQLVEDVKMIVQHHLDAKPQLIFNVEWEQSVPNVILGDPIRLRQLFLGLVGNAIKFTESGHVTVRGSVVQPLDGTEEESLPTESPHIVLALDPQIAQAKGLRGTVVHPSGSIEQQTVVDRTQTATVAVRCLPPDASVLRIDVTDTGIGIAKEQFETLFTAFAQVDNTLTRQFGGTGLGLSIVKGLVQLMGGKVQVKSELGRGSTFSLLIPITKHDDSVVPYKTSGGSLRHEKIDTKERNELPLWNYNILIVDDVPVNRMVLEAKLREMGAKIQCAPNGLAAVDMVAEAEVARNPFDFVLMDLQMPIMDGFEATHTLRQRGFTKPIVALTANHGNDAQAIAAGCNQVLQKPTNRETLLDAITGLMPKT